MTCVIHFHIAVLKILFLFVYFVYTY